MSNSNEKATGLGARTIIIPAGVTTITRFAPIAGAISCLLTNVNGVTAMILDSPPLMGQTIGPSEGLSLLAAGNAYALSDARTISLYGVPQIFLCAGATAIINVLFTEQTSGA